MPPWRAHGRAPEDSASTSSDGNHGNPNPIWLGPIHQRAAQQPLQEPLRWALHLTHQTEQRGPIRHQSVRQKGPRHATNPCTQPTDPVPPSRPPLLRHFRRRLGHRHRQRRCHSAVLQSLPPLLALLPMQAPVRRAPQALPSPMESCSHNNCRCTDQSSLCTTEHGNLGP